MEIETVDVQEVLGILTQEQKELMRSPDYQSREVKLRVGMLEVIKHDVQQLDSHAVDVGG